MYLNAFLVEDLAESLQTKLKGARLIGAFSTGKFELYLLFSCPFALRIQFFKGEAFFQEVPFDHIQKVNRLPS